MTHSRRSTANENCSHHHYACSCSKPSLHLNQFNMLFRGHHEPIMRRGGNVVHRFATGSRGCASVDSFHADNDTEQHDSSKRLRMQSFSIMARRLYKRIVFILLLGIMTVSWQRNVCSNLFPRQASAVASHEFSSHPLMIQAPFHLLTNATALQIDNDPPHLVKKRKNRYWINNGMKEYGQVPSIPEGCEAEEWVNDLHQSCLDIHQVDLTNFFFNKKRTAVRIDGNKRRKKVRFLGAGGFRAALLFHESSGERRVLKTLKYSDERDFSPRNLDRMRRDAVVSEQLTASPHIANIYGYCAQTALVDYSNGDNMDWIFDQETKPTKDELFRIAVDVAQSIADAHHVNSKTSRATIVHMDVSRVAVVVLHFPRMFVFVRPVLIITLVLVFQIKPDQWIQLNGRWVLNDFNLAKFLSWDPVEQENCNVASGYSGNRFQAPEQLNKDSPRSEKLDVFALGNMLGFLLTQDGPFPDLSDESVEKEVAKGRIWKITDPKLLESKHPFDVNVRKAMEMCMVVDPKRRPSAQAVADMLRKALSKYNKSKRSR